MMYRRKTGVVIAAMAALVAGVLGLTPPARAGCGTKPLSHVKCRQGKLRFKACRNFAPVEVFLDDCLIATLAVEGNYHKMSVTGLEPGEYEIRVVNSRRFMRKKTVVCQ